MIKIIPCLLKLEKRNKESEMWEKREKGHVRSIVAVNTGKKTAQHSERVQKGIIYWNKQNTGVSAPNCILKVWGKIIKDKGL